MYTTVCHFKLCLSVCWPLCLSISWSVCLLICQSVCLGGDLEMCNYFREKIITFVISLLQFIVYQLSGSVILIAFNDSLDSVLVSPSLLRNLSSGVSKNFDT